MLAGNHVICSILSLSNVIFFCYRNLIEKAVLKWGRFFLSPSRHPTSEKNMVGGWNLEP